MLHSLLALAQQPRIAPTEGDFWFPPQASSFAGKLDADYYFIYWVSAFFVFVIAGVLVLFTLKYHTKKHPKAERTSTHNTPLELAWSILPGIVLLYMFVLGFEGFTDLRTPPSNAVNVDVTAQKWAWTFTYPNGVVHDELHVEKDQPVQLTLASVDVIHSFWVAAFRTKMDAVPGRYTKLWFTPTMTGEFWAQCTEYCGTNHSMMRAKVVVHEPGELAKWLAVEGDPHGGGRTPAQAGEKIYKIQGCAACHTLDGSKLTGPSFKGLFGREEQLVDGSTVAADENYIRESILNPQAKIVSGYGPPSTMPTFQGRLKEDDIAALIAFLRTVK